MCLGLTLRQDGLLLPADTSCPACHGAMTWGEVIRACYGRKEGVERERVAIDKEARRQARQVPQVRRRSSRTTSQASSTEDEDS